MVKCVVYANAKILNWKQFTTMTKEFDAFISCLCKCKDTKLKAIHNRKLGYLIGRNVVYANAKILNWKQFTTEIANCCYGIGLFMQMQRY